jgi:DNA-binding NarL/FixJ family response regulator
VVSPYMFDMTDRRVDVIPAAGSCLAHGLAAALSVRGWEARLVPAAAGQLTDRRMAVLVVEDDDGADAVPARLASSLRVQVAVGSSRSLPRLMTFAREGATILHEGPTFAALLGRVESALRRPLDDAGRARQAAALQTRATERRALDRLTASESEILVALMTGLSAAHIADQSHRSMHTVRSHIKAVLAKLDVTSQLAAVALAHRAAWPEIDPPAAISPQFW